MKDKVKPWIFVPFAVIALALILNVDFIAVGLRDFFGMESADKWSANVILVALFVYSLIK